MEAGAAGLTRRAVTPAVRSRGYWSRSWRRFRKDRLAVVAVCVLLAIVAAGLLAGRIAPYSYQHFDIGLDAINLGPTAAGHHFFGTDGVGHDVLSQTLFGIKTTVFVGLFVGVCASLLGIVVGAVAGWFGGWLDALLMRVVDCLVTIPALAVLFTGIVLTQRQPRPHWVTEALILYLWISMARVVRASFVQLREAEFVEAARAAGASGARIVLRHVLPNASAAVIVTATGIVGQAMLLEATVEFFGYGFDPWVTPSLGGLISRGANSGLGLDNGVFTYWWLWAFPAAALVLVLTCINFIGDSLDEALNPAGSAEVLAYLVRRLIFALFLVVAISFASFWLLAAHIDPLWPLLFANPQPVARIHALTVQNHLDQPVPERYWLWVKGIFAGGDGRHTILDQTPIWPSVWTGFVHTAELAAGAFALALVLSVVMGVVAASRSGRATDRLLRTVAYLTWSTPVFVTALVLQWASVHVATTGAGAIFSSGPPTGSGAGYVVSWYRHMALPVVAVALSFVGLYCRYIRSGMLVSLSAPYSTVARAKGLTESRVLVRHALRTALVPFFAVVTLDFGALVGATLVVDVVFGLQGLGSLFLDSISAADPFQLEAVLIVTVLVVVGLTLLVDVAYPWLDPRIRIT